MELLVPYAVCEKLLSWVGWERGVGNEVRSDWVLCALASLSLTGLDVGALISLC